MLSLMFVIRIKWGSVLVRKTMTAELAMNAQMGTLVILIANPVTVNLITQLVLYVIKLMEHADVWTDLVEEDVMIAMMDSSDILIALIVHADKT
jgi:hypothetical protein